MADNMMRIAGRGMDGLAKPIKTDEQGYIRVGGIPKIGKNLFNKLTVTSNYCLGASGLVSAAGWCTSDFITVIGGSVLTVKTVSGSAVAGLGLFQGSQQVSWMSNDSLKSDGHIVNIPLNVTSIRISMAIAVLESQQVEYGNISTVFEAYKEVSSLETTAQLSAVGEDKKVMELSGIQDPLSGNFYLGTVDLAPVAYDPIAKRLKTETRVNKSIIMADLSRTVSLNATNGFVQIVMTAPVGELWHIRDIFFSAAAISGATTGTHRLAVIQGNHFTHGERLTFATAHNKALLVSKNMASASVDTPDPSEKLLQVQLIKSLLVQNGNDTLLQFVYYNNSNVAQTDALITCKVWYEREYVL